MRRREKKVLIVAAHPDDEVLGCGGTIARLVRDGAKVFTMILVSVMSSRLDKMTKGKKMKDEKRVKAYVDRAAGALGVEKTFLFDFPDNKLDSVPLLEIVKVIEKVKNEVRPDAIYTHYRNDLNIDHRIAYSALLTACRPLKGESVKEIYSFEIPSSTEWVYPLTFSPNMFTDITESIDKKIEALRSYKTELKEFPHPRSEEAVRTIAKRWGAVSNLRYAEAFEAVRIIK